MQNTQSERNWRGRRGRYFKGAQTQRGCLQGQEMWWCTHRGASRCESVEEQRTVASNSDGPTATAPAAVCLSADGPDDLIATHEVVANY